MANIHSPVLIFITFNTQSFQIFILPIMAETESFNHVLVHMTYTSKHWRNELTLIVNLMDGFNQWLIFQQFGKIAGRYQERWECLK